MKHDLFLLLTSLLILMQCQPNNASSEATVSKPMIHTIQADLETKPVKTNFLLDAADDPAIWVHPTTPSKSLLFGTDKKSGIAVYDLSGQEVHFARAGQPNNIDVRNDFQLGNGDSITIVACSERTKNEIQVYRLDTTATSLHLISGGRLKCRKGEVYGFSLYHSAKTGKHFAFINTKGGLIEQWELQAFDVDGIIGQIVRRLRVRSQPEGMVADDELGWLYVGEETRGIWKFHAEPDSTDQGILLENSGSSNRNITYDIEGLTIYYGPNANGYLIASSQGNNSFAIFQRGEGNAYLGSFRIGQSATIDGTRDTDGIDVIATPLDTLFPHGLFIAQDGANSKNNKPESQNFKVVAWEKIARAFDPPLLIQE